MTLVVGAAAPGVGAALHEAGLTGITTIDTEVLRSEFDDATDTWMLHTAADESVRADVVIQTNPRAFLPWIPKINGSADFRGDSFHAAAWDPHFHPAGKRVAVVGTDSWAGHRLPHLAETAAALTVFAHAPRRVVTNLPPRTKRWVRRHPQPGPSVVSSAITAVTATGILTSDGIEHPADAIVYGTGFTIGEQVLLGANGQTIQQAWVDGLEPFLGMAVHGFPNYFFVAGPDTEAQLRYVAQCLAAMQRTGSRRIEVRRSSLQVFNERAQLAPASPPAVTGAFDTFDLSASAPDYEDTYDGAATLEIGGTSYPVRVRLIGHLDPLDGNYHWQGTVLDALPEESVKRTRAVTLTVGGRSAAARIVERTPWGTHSVAGVGAPPYVGSSR